MKILCFLFCLFLCSFAFAQTYKTAYELVTVQSEQHLYLDKRSKMNAKSRNHIAFQLPANTVWWTYSFGTTVNQKSVQQAYNLKTVLGMLVKANLGTGGEVAFSAVSGLAEPSGVAAVDVYLTDAANKNAYLSYDMLKVWIHRTAPPYYYEKASRKNFKSGVVASQLHTTAPLYLVFNNAEMFQGVSVSVQIEAYVAKKVYVDEWTTHSKNILNKNCLAYFAHQTEAVQNICGCVLEQVVAKETPKAFLEASKERQELAFKQAKRHCYEATGHAHVEEQDAQIKQLYKDIYGLREVKDYPALVTKYEQLIQLGKKEAATYNGVAWNCLLSRQWDKAKQALTAGLGENPNDLYLQGNLAHYYLLTGDYEACKAIHLRFKGQELKEDWPWKKMVQEDLLLFEELDIYHADFNKVRQLVGLPKGRLAQVFDARYAIGGKVAFERGNKPYVGIITALDKDRGENTLAYQNIYGEEQSMRLSVTKVTPLSPADYATRLAAWEAEIARYKYTVGELGIWQKQQKKLFGRITQLNDSRHQATLEHTNIYGEIVYSQVPYLDITILSPIEFDQLNQDWQTTIAQYQFQVGEQVTWTTTNILNGLKTKEQGEIIQLNANTHQAHIRYVNKKDKEKVIKKNYLALEKIKV